MPSSSTSPPRKRFKCDNNIGFRGEDVGSIIPEAASPSTSSVHKGFKYDVFLSFRGEDVRKTFVDHLYASFERQGICTFKDDKKLEKGKRIDNQLIDSIQNSNFFIIVFSQNYASSSWCLDELVKIMECVKNRKQIAYPVFYNVDPSEVRKQTESYEKALDEHNKKEDVGKEDIKQWREALKEAGSLVGYHVEKIADGHEAEVIKQIVAEISKKLCSSYESNNEKLVGMETRMQDLLSCLEIGSNDVRMIGIKGMGGAGKTTLAQAIFDMISFRFEGVSFVDNVRENSKASVSGLQPLQKKVLSDVLKEPDITVSSSVDGKQKMKNRLCFIKVLLVLDDVDHISQLEALAGALSWFKSGSRIIITTRNDQVLVAHGVEIKHDVSMLSNAEAIRLFSMYAGGGDMPSERYEKLSKEVVDYAAGLPLTVKVLGSLLRGQGESVWIDLLKRLEKIPLKETLDILELSYNSLENDHKEIFLDVACLLRHWNKKEAISVLESCGFNATYGLRVLEQRSLITIDGDDYLDMHDHIQEMGMNIVRRDHPHDPSKHSRLWIGKEIEDILVDDSGTKATRCIEGFVHLDPEIVMKGFGRMKNLRVLLLKSHHYSGFFPTDRKFDDAAHYFPNALQYLNWEGYPFCSLPKSFQANNLVLDNLNFLKLHHSKLTKLDLELTPNLKTLCLSQCRKLVELDLSARCPKLRSLNLMSCSKLKKLELGPTPNIKTLDLSQCDKLVELDMSAGCPKLRSLNMMSCSKLTKLELGPTPNLETLFLHGCSMLVELHMSAGCPKLRTLSLMSCSKLTKLEHGPFPNLETLDISECDKLVEIDVSAGCPKLKSLNLMSCSKLRKLELGQTLNFETLDLSQCDELVELDISVGCIKLKSLNLISCSKLTKLELGPTPNLTTLDLDGCDELVELDMSAGCPMLRCLSLECSNLTKLELGPNPNLEELFLSPSNKLVELDLSAGCLELRSLLIMSKLTKLEVGPTPNLEMLGLCGCDESLELDMLARFPELKYLFLLESKLTKLDLGRTPNLETLELSFCDKLVELDMSARCAKLISLNLMSCSKLTKLNLGLTPNLDTLDLSRCDELVELDMSAGCLTLRSLNLMSCSKLTKLELGRTPNLETLDLSQCDKLLEIDMSVGCPKLISLNLMSCSKLTKLDIGLTPNLETLDLSQCDELVELDMSVGCPKLRSLNLMSCPKLTKLDLGPTPNREMLDLSQFNKLVEHDVSVVLESEPKLLGLICN